MDALLPPEMARRAEEIGVQKTLTPAFKLFFLAVLGGAFIGLGATFAHTVAAGSGGALSYGVVRMLVGLAFSLGFVLVVVGGAELFTGNNLLVMAWAGRKVGTGALLRNWVLVYLGNAVGALATAALVLFARQHEMGKGSVGAVALAAGAAKVRLEFGQAVALGILCNGLVCLALWLSLSARSTADRILAVVPPITAFVACGFEHSVANLFSIPLAIAIATTDPKFAAASGVDLEGLTASVFLVRNLLPVTIGNVLGGSVLVAGVYWLIYLRPRSAGGGGPSG